ncbi:RNA polymerase sigma-70 factor [Albibacterium indicum]|uniref:RNA polymerase sigma-70 factor n=1 Tax=Albibacterium indicum TaxID=2292082 RepID=UPI0013008BCD|nr:RNA polymerase sigma-70 factor [Pedobacter indicus]
MKEHFSFKGFSENTSEKIFREYYARLSYFAFKFVNDKDVAEDLVQDAFLAYWNSKKQIPYHPKAIKDFLYSSVKNAALNVLKRQKVKERYFSLRTEDDIENRSVLDNMIEAEVINDVHRAIAQLPQSCRNVFMLAYFDGLSNPKIAEKLKISVNTVRSHKQNGLRILRGQLKPELFVTILAVLLK